jgi:Asp-tRNA(Asn)/Glu-tRNA(Gln) amidotransferase C subunit
MSRPSFSVTPEGVAAYSKMFGIEVSEDEMATISNQLPSVLREVEQLWDVDVSEHEMSVIFPIDR